MSREDAKYPGLNLDSSHGEDHEDAEGLMFGFWVFLMSDVILFAMVFASYITSLQAGAGGPGPLQLYDLKSVFFETMILLASSFTFGMASLSVKYKQGVPGLSVWLVATLLLGVGFLAFELHDFSVMFAKGGVPSRSGLLSAFFGLVPLHGVHVACGCIWLVCLLGQIARYGLDSETKNGIMRLALFWHFLDIVWVAVFSIVYLGGLA
ncbi:MAG: cytochrome c oxidase subunit 3 [Janthinobacterium lividum]